jgi:hypothetical protein
MYQVMLTGDLPKGLSLEVMILLAIATAYFFERVTRVAKLKGYKVGV